MFGELAKRFREIDGGDAARGANKRESARGLAYAGNVCLSV